MVEKKRLPLQKKEEVMEFVQSLSEKEIDHFLLFAEAYLFAKEMAQKSKDETSAAIA